MKIRYFCYFALYTTTMDLENKQPRCNFSVEFPFKLRTIARIAIRKISSPMKKGIG